MVVAVRHGRTDYNEKDAGGEAEIYRGNLNIPLNAQGQAEAKEAAGKIGLPVRAVVCDNYPRDRQTAEIIAADRGAPVLIDERMAPWDIGLLSGKYKSAVKDLVDWFVAHPDVSVPGGESFGDFYQRQQKAIFDYLDQDQGAQDSAIVIVCQGSTFRSLDAMMNDDDWSLIESTTERVPTGDLQWLT